MKHPRATTISGLGVNGHHCLIWWSQTRSFQPHMESYSSSKMFQRWPKALMLKLYSHSAASLRVLMVPISTGAPQFPYCTPSSPSGLSAPLSNGSTGRLVIALMDDRTRRGVASLALELVEVQRPATPTPSRPIASRLWHIISPVICGQIEVEGDREIFCPHENRWMLQRCRLSRELFLFFPTLLEEPSCFMRDWFHAP